MDPKIAEAQAVALSKVLKDIPGELTTKTDLEQLEKALRADIDRLQGVFRTDMARLEGKFDTLEERTKGRFTLLQWTPAKVPHWWC